MDFRGVLILCTQLWVILAKSDCPKECTCVRANFGGTVAHCSELNINQTFSNSIHHLNVTNANVPYLESKFFQKVHLEELQSIKIINSSLTIIDEYAFAGMTNLNFMDLSDNMIKHIPPYTFKNNSNLQMLSLSGNRISLTSQPIERSGFFLKSSALTDLDLSRCEIRHITSETFVELPNLMSLNLDSNFINFISPQMFDKLEFLEEINLSNNFLSDLDPQLFTDIEDMTTLKLSNNSLSKFDDVDISILKELDLSYNMFKSLESTTLEGTQDVAIVNFSHNAIEKIDDDTFTDLNKLRYLDLSHNKLKGPLSQFVFETNEELETLFLSHNRNLSAFEGFTGEFKFLYRLDISYCGLTNIKEDAFENLQHISTLDLSGNALVDLNPRTFIKLARLNNLDLSENELTSLHEDIFQGNMDLRKVSIRGNRIHHLPARLFKPTVHLSSFDASNCHLTYLWNAEELDYIKESKILNQLAYFNLEGNKFTTLHKHSFESMKNLKTLDLSKNPFQCEEHFILLIEWLIDQKISITRYFGKSSADLEHEHSKLHWADMLSNVCSKTFDVIPMTNILEKKYKKPSVQVNAINDDVQKENYEKEDTDAYYNSKFDKTKNSKQENKDAELYMGNIPEIDYASNFGLVPEPVIKSTAPNESEYPWIWPLFLVFICGASILLALFNLGALLLYRTGNSSHNCPATGYRSTFIAPLSGQLKIRRDAGSYYHKLYEECSVPNSSPIIKQSGDFLNSPKKNTIILSGATKGEDMV